MSSLYLSLLIGLIVSDKKKYSYRCYKPKYAIKTIIKREISSVVPVTRLISSTTQIDGKLDHMSNCGREHWKDVKVVHSPDIPVVALVTLLFQAKLGYWSLQVWTNDDRNQRWNL